jgi:hypothetical protein
MPAARVERRTVVRLARLLPREDVDDALRPRQRADVGDEDAVGAGLHAFSP